MFESANLKHHLDKAVYKREAGKLRHIRTSAFFDPSDEEREKVSFKRFKITDEDWRNRKQWDEYETAVCDMVDRTSTSLAPWTLVEANNKYHARIKVLKTFCRAAENALERVGKAGARKGGRKK